MIYSDDMVKSLEGITVITEYSPKGVDQIIYPGENGNYGIYFPQESKLIVYDNNNVPIKEINTNTPIQKPAVQNTIMG